MNVMPMRRRFTTAEYHSMGEAGILRPDERTELVDGAIIVMPPIGPGHADSVRVASLRLIARLGSHCVVSVQNPIWLGENDEPQPDIALLRSREGGYRQAHPGAEDIFLVIEVSDSAVRFDRDQKLPRDAAAGIAEAWLINLTSRRIEVHRDPGPNGYRTVLIVGPGDTLSPLAFPDVAFTGLELLS